MSLIVPLEIFKLSDDLLELYINRVDLSGLLRDQEEDIQHEEEQEYDQSEQRLAQERGKVMGRSTIVQDQSQVVHVDTDIEDQEEGLWLDKPHEGNLHSLRVLVSLRLEVIFLLLQENLKLVYDVIDGFFLSESDAQLRA